MKTRAFSPIAARLAGLIGGLCVAAALAGAADPDIDFRPAAIQADVTFLADDLLQGRLPGTREYDIAALYVATQFSRMGLQPGNRGTWLQSVALQETSLDNASTALSMSGPNDTRRWQQGSEALVYASALKSDQDIEAPLVFAGFGLDAPRQGFDDYSNLNVRGKIVVVLSGTPKGTPSEIGAHLNAEKQKMAERRGAIGIVNISTRLDQSLFPWKRQVEESETPRVSWVGSDGRPFVDAPGVEAFVAVSPEVAKALFSGARHSLDAVLDEADRQNARPKGFALPARARIQWRSSTRAFSSPNVLGMIPGSDPRLSDQVVLMIAHLDHVGIRRARNGDGIINGAMDNAAGVAIALEVARAFMTSEARPRRSVLFMTVTGEESGLLGTFYFANNPPVPLERIVAVVNLDVPVLTYDFTDVIAFGAEHSTLGAVAAKSAAAAGVRLSPDPMPAEGIFTRSDHYALVRKGVPALFLTTGFGGGGEKAWKTYLSQHYHQPTDDLSQPFNWQAAARFAQITWHLLAQIANDTERPRWNQGDFFGDTFSPGTKRACERCE